MTVLLVIAVVAESDKLAVGIRGNWRNDSDFGSFLVFFNLFDQNKRFHFLSSKKNCVLFWLISPFTPQTQARGGTAYHRFVRPIVMVTTLNQP